MPRPRLTPRPGPQALLPYRAAVGVTVLVAIVAVVSQGAVSAALGALCVLLVPVGFAVSYLRRDKRNVLLKVGLALGLFAAFGAFLGGVRGAASLDDTRAPLTALFCWVQVLHSFDVPRRRDLAFSIAASVALIALAGSLSYSTGFLVFFVLYTACFLVALALGHEARLRELAPHAAREVAGPGGRPPDAAALARPAAGLVALTLVSALLVFVALPRLPGVRVAALPFQLAGSSPISNFLGEVVNPGAPASAPGGRAAGFAPDAYFGYGDRLDLRVRGRLSEELVLRVRSPEPSLWRAQAYDRYDGTGWTSTAGEPFRVGQEGDGSIRPPFPIEGGSGHRREVVQTFFVERELPNLVFHAADAEELYLPATSVRVDDFGSIRLPFTLEEDTIYSVISQVPSSTPEDLRWSPPADRSDPTLARFLDVPDTLGPRFHRLAAEITAGSQTAVDKAQAVEDWLRRTKRYRLDIPPDPPGRDPVDVFLFERHEGFCEQIATAMALLLRSAGVPTRLVTGFGPGERNLFTGYWEVRNADAHAWVEVYYPGFGWIPYDPTFGVPEATGSSTTFMLEPLGRLVGSLVPTGAVRRAVDVVTGFAGPAGAAAALLLPVGLALALLRRRRPRRFAATSVRDQVVAVWLDVEHALRARGCPRADHETVREFAARARRQPGVDAAALDELVEVFLRLRYGPRAPGPEDVELCRELAARATLELGRGRAPAFAVRA